MSIKLSELMYLRNKFLDNCPAIDRVVEEIKRLSEEFARIIESDSSYGLSPVEFRTLSGLVDFFTPTGMTLGKHFKSRYYPDSKDDPRVSYSVSLTVLIPKTYPKKFNEPYSPDFKSTGLLEKLIPINDEIISLQNLHTEITDNFRRFINENTSRTWLKDNLPDVYEYLKHENI